MKIEKLEFLHADYKKGDSIDVLYRPSLNEMLIVKKINKLIDAHNANQELDENDLKVCPFCGPTRDGVAVAERKHKDSYVPKGYVVYCLNCGCEPDFYVPTKEEAMKKWNTRV